MTSPIALAPVTGEPELLDPAITGQFAEELAAICAEVQTPPWCAYVGRRDAIPVGFGAFKQVPSAEGVVEIGYLTFPAHEGTGVATEVAAAMIAVARANCARAVIAHTLPQTNASTAVLRKNLFARDGEAVDPDEGTVWRWRLVL